jgi:hypothetical protein
VSELKLLYYRSIRTVIERVREREREKRERERQRGKERD